jgi:hypothetical protein
MIPTNGRTAEHHPCQDRYTHHEVVAPRAVGTCLQFLRQPLAASSQEAQANGIANCKPVGCNVELFQLRKRLGFGYEIDAVAPWSAYA